MRKICISTSILFFICTIITSAAPAEEADKLQGSLGVGVMFINSGNNLNPSGSKRYLDDLNSAADKEASIIPLVLPNVTYDVGDKGGLKLYLDTRPPVDEVGSFVFKIGGNYPLEAIGILDVNIFFTPFEEAWENPYAVGVRRKTTSTSKYGTQVALNKIMGTELRVNFVFLKDDVDEDVIGTLVPELGRDGEVYALNANYSFHPTESLELRPRLGVRKGSYDGDSNSFIKYKIDLEARYSTGKLILMPRISYSRSEYDEINPIFNKTREGDDYGLGLMAIYSAPFGWEDWALQGLFNYSIGDSNITFYETEGISTGIFMSYRF
ncbi:MAG: DUF2860 family protein [Desulforhopalus sp.]